MIYNPKTKQQILDNIAYPCPHAEKATINVSSVSSTSELPPRPRASSSGRLEALPIELILKILLQLDFVALWNLRITSSHVKDIVESLPAYRDLTRCAHNSLLALSATTVLHRFTVQQLHSTLCDPRCTRCSNAGQFLFLPTCSRVCYSCMTTSSQFSVVGIADAALGTKLKEKDFRQIAVLKTVRGEYGSTPSERYGGSSEQVRKRRLRILSANEALKLPRCVENPSCINYMKCGELVLRFAACTPMPWLNLKKNRIENGLCCKGCEYDWTADGLPIRRDHIEEFRKRRDRVFFKDEFSTHFEECKSAKTLWDKYVLEEKTTGHSVEARSL